MRVVLATGQYAEPPGPVAAADQLAEGWRRQAPRDEVIAAPVSDGGSGFVEVLAHALGGAPAPVVVTGPRGDQVPAQVLQHEDTAYLEAGQAAGRHLVGEAELADPGALTSHGVGELLAAALDAGATRVVLGCGDLACHDGGRGMLRALGAGEDLSGLPQLRQRLRGTTLVLAHATGLPLTGFHGASAVLGTEHGLPTVLTQALEEELGLLTDRINAVLPPQRDLLTGQRIRAERTDGAGVGGGVGYAAILLGAQAVPGARFVMEETGLARLLPGALVVTGQASYDWHAIHDGVIPQVATAALEVASPSIVLAEQVLVGRREGMSLGISAAYDPREGEDLAGLAERVARTWSPRP